MQLVLNEKTVRDLQLPPGKTRAIFHDLRQPGLIIVQGKTGTYAVRVEHNGTRHQESLGPVDSMTVTEARRKAAAVIGRIRENKLTPGQLIKQASTGPTFRQALDSYLVWLRNQGGTSGDRVLGEVTRYLSDWFDRPLRSIRYTDCEKRHEEISLRGKHVANRVIGNFGTVWNRHAIIARREDPTWPGNPTEGVSWHRDGQPDFESRRREPIPIGQLPLWWKSVHEIDSDRRRNYQLLVMFTGIRRNDGMTLRWEHLNLTVEPIEVQVYNIGKGRKVPVWLHAGSMIRPNPKGGFQKAFSVPLPRYLIDLLIKQRAEHTDDDGGWVFPGYAAKMTACKDCRALGLPGHVAGELSHMRDSRQTHIATGKLSPGEGAWSMHRCRDRYMTSQESVQMPVGIGHALVNHRYSNATVSDGYRRPSTEDLREWQEIMCAHLLDLMQPERKHHLQAVA